MKRIIAAKLLGLIILTTSESLETNADEVDPSLITRITNSGSSLIENKLETSISEWTGSLKRRHNCNIVLVNFNVRNGSNPWWTRVAEIVRNKLEDSSQPLIFLDYHPHFSFFSPLLDAIPYWKSTCSDYFVLLVTPHQLDHEETTQNLTAAIASIKDQLEFAIKVMGRDKNPFLNIITRQTFKTTIEDRVRDLGSVCILLIPSTSPEECKDGENVCPDTITPSNQTVTCRHLTSDDLKGRKLNVTAFPTLPAVIWKTLPDNKIEGDGVDFLMISSLSKKFNFTFQIEPPIDGFWGHLDDTGVTIHGMTGQVVHGEADLAIGDFFQMYQLNLGADYAIYGRGCTAISVPNPARYQVWMAVLSIFKASTWILIGFVNFVPFMFKFLPDKGLFARNYGHHKRSYEWVDHMRILLDMEPGEEGFMMESLPTRLAINGFGAFAFFISAFFEAAFFLKLTVPQYYPSIESLDSLIASGLPMRINSLYSFLVDANPDKRQALLNMGSKDVPLNLDQALDMVVVGKAVTVEGWHETVFAQKVRFSDALGNNPKFHIINRCFMPANSGWVVPKHAYYSTNISRALQKLVEGGLIDKYRRDVESYQRTLRVRDAAAEQSASGRSGHIPEAENGNIRILAIQQMSWIFAIGGIGMGTALLVFIIELCNTPKKENFAFTQPRNRTINQESEL